VSHVVTFETGPRYPANILLVQRKVLTWAPDNMSNPKAAQLLTTAQVAEKLGASPAKVKKAIASLGIEPTAKKGVCNYFDATAVKKISTAIKRSVRYR